MNDAEKLAAANEIISNNEKTILSQERIIETISLEKEKLQVRIWRFEAKLEVFQDIVEALAKELRGDK